MPGRLARLAAALPPFFPPTQLQSSPAAPERSALAPRGRLELSFSGSAAPWLVVVLSLHTSRKHENPLKDRPRRAAGSRRERGSVGRPGRREQVGFPTLASAVTLLRCEEAGALSAVREQAWRVRAIGWIATAAKSVHRVRNRGMSSAAWTAESGSTGPGGSRSVAVRARAAGSRGDGCASSRTRRRARGGLLERERQQEELVSSGRCSEPAQVPRTRRCTQYTMPARIVQPYPGDSSAVLAQGRARTRPREGATARGCWSRTCS